VSNRTNVWVPSVLAWGFAVVLGLPTARSHAQSAPADCTAARWASVAGSVALGSSYHNPPTQRFSDPCAAVADAVGDYVVDDSPSNDAALSLRFYARVQTTGVSSVAVLRGQSSSSTNLINVWTNGTSLFLSVSGAQGTGEVPVQAGAWYAIEIDWRAGAPGNFSYRVTGPSPTGIVTASGQLVPQNSADRLERVRLGAVDGTLQGTIGFDAYATTRVGTPELLCRCDANGDLTINVLDRGAISGELAGSGLAAGQPDCNHDGTVSVLDRGGVTALMSSGQTNCPAASTNIVFADTFRPSPSVGDGGRATLSDWGAGSWASEHATAVKLGNGEHHFYDLHYRTLRRFHVENAGAGNQLVEERPVSSAVSSVVADIYAAHDQNPGILHAYHTAGIGIETIPGPHDPVGIALDVPSGSFPGGASYFNFMRDLRHQLDVNPDGLDPRLGTLIRLIRRVEGVSIERLGGLEWDSVTAMVELSLCQADGDCAVVAVDPKTLEVRFLRSHDETGNAYPARHGNDSISWQFDLWATADDFRDRMNEYGVEDGSDCVTCNPTGTWYLICTYVGGILDSCYITSDQ